MPTKNKPLIGICAPVSIVAGEQQDGGKKSPAKFDVNFYNGGRLSINGWEYDVVVDNAGLKVGNVLVANQFHDSKRPVGNFKVDNNGTSLRAIGTATAATVARDEVVNSALEGYEWQASLEVMPQEVEFVKAGKTAEANGQTFEGPVYITRKGTLKGFGFVTHGADDTTAVTIAASAASFQEKNMNPEFKKWIEAMGFDADSLSAEQVAGLQANYEGLQKPKAPAKKLKLDDAIDAKASEIARVEAITEIAVAACDKRPYDIAAIKQLANDAVEAKWTVEKFRLELLEATIPVAGPFIHASDRRNRISSKVVEAAICQAGKLDEATQAKFGDETNQVAHDRFKGNIGLKQLMLLAAEQNGYRSGHSQNVDVEVQRAAFGLRPSREIHATGFSTIDISSIIANTANKFLYVGWMSVDQTSLRISSVRNVRDFKTITTVSLTGDLQYTQVGGGGEIKHGTLGELSYTNKADTYATMLAITRQDIINDDLGALTVVPRRLGRGAMLTLNHIFWTEFLAGEAAGFWASGNSNINTGAADMTLAGLTATEIIFMNQTDPDGKPLGIEPAILLVPTALKATANALTDPQSQIITGSDTKISNANVFRGRFRVESTPYLSNSSYTGYSAIEWYMMADPNVLPTIEIAALNGKVEPTVETADADFNVLGIQMRGYSDVGVNLQEKRASVLADGNAS